MARESRLSKGNRADGNVWTAQPGTCTSRFPLLAKLYGMETNIDENFGRLLKRLDELKLTDNTIAANGTYQMQFALFDGSNAQIGSTITNPTVQVVNGIFTVTLDFGAGAFPGASRFLQIGVFSSKRLDNCSFFDVWGDQS